MDMKPLLIGGTIIGLGLIGSQMLGSGGGASGSGDGARDSGYSPSGFIAGSGEGGGSGYSLMDILAGLPSYPSVSFPDGKNFMMESDIPQNVGYSLSDLGLSSGWQPIGWTAEAEGDIVEGDIVEGGGRTKKDNLSRETLAAPSLFDTWKAWFSGAFGRKADGSGKSKALWLAEQTDPYRENELSSRVDGKTAKKLQTHTESIGRYQGYPGIFQGLTKSQIESRANSAGIKKSSGGSKRPESSGSASEYKSTGVW